MNRAHPTWLAMTILPLIYLVAAFWLRAEAGPDWLWFNVDPAYFYLFDPLNILELTAPGSIYHPGTTVQWIGALTLKLSAPLTPTDTLVETALRNPEAALRLICTVFTMLNALALFAAGLAALTVWKDPLGAAVVQLAPFVSMLVLKNSVFPRPEALIVFTTLMLVSASLLTLAPGLLERHRGRFAFAFGMIAGFGTVTKLTMAPVFILPVILLARPRAVGWYLFWTCAGLIAFALPIMPKVDLFLDWVGSNITASGAYGSGAAGFADWATYPHDVLHLFKRPLFHGVFILSLMTLAAAMWRRRKGRTLPASELRLLAGIAASQLVHVLLIAKQPSAHYLIASFMLIPLALVLIWRSTGGVWGSGATTARRLRIGMAAVLFILIGVQGHATWKTGTEFAFSRKAAMGFEDSRFEHCARIYFASASSPSYALANGDFITGGNFAERLAAIRPANDFWFEHSWHDSPLSFRGWRGPEDVGTVLERYPCALLRGSRWNEIDTAVLNMAPALKTAVDCSIPGETILVSGADCSGNLTGAAR